MKKQFLLICAAIVFTAAVYIFGSMSISAGSEAIKPAGNMTNIIRFHVIANSDSIRDQQLKRAVRDVVVQVMQPKFYQACNLADAQEIAKSNLLHIQQIAGQKVRQEGYNYPVKVEFGSYQFPAKSYGSFVLAPGTYQAVKVLIGQGAGENWWCVLFPPLCFVDLSQNTAVLGEKHQNIVPVAKLETKNIDNENEHLEQGGQKDLNRWEDNRREKNLAEADPDGKKYEIKFGLIELIKKIFS